jgi:hypothetical protein
MRRSHCEEMARVETESRAMARSGIYRSHVEIRNVLAERREATTKVFGNLWSRTEIDRLCRLARTSASLS